MAILKSKIAAAVALAVTMTACYTDFDPDLRTPPVLCLNAVMKAGEPIEAEVTRTWRYNDPAGEADHAVGDARVTVTVNGATAGADYRPAPGDRVRIRAVSPTFGTAESEVEIPPVPQIDDVRTDVRMRRVGMFRYPDADRGDSIVTAVDFTFNLAVDMTVSDPGPGLHYFMAGAGSVHDGCPFEGEGGDATTRFYFSDGYLNYDAEPIFAEHVSALEAVAGYSAWGFSFFTDRTFTDGSYRLKLRFENMYIRLTSVVGPDEAAIADDRIIEALDFALDVDVSSVTESLYNWANYTWQANEGMVGDLGNIGLGAPIRGYSNVSTGAGIVGAAVSRARRVELRGALTGAFLGALENN